MLEMSVFTISFISPLFITCARDNMYIPPSIYISMLDRYYVIRVEIQHVLNHFQYFGVYICHQIYSYVIKYILQRNKFWLLDLDL